MDYVIPIGRNDLLLAACMHSGFAVLRYNHDQGSFDEEATQRFHGDHTSLAYGADWQYLTGTQSIHVLSLYELQISKVSY
jgi:hypothetical protein